MGRGTPLFPPNCTAAFLLHHAGGAAPPVRLIDIPRSVCKTKLSRLTCPAPGQCVIEDRAVVAELADAHGSGPCTRKGVGVRVPPSAPNFSLMPVSIEIRNSTDSLPPFGDFCGFGSVHPCRSKISPQSLLIAKFGRPALPTIQNRTLRDRRDRVVQPWQPSSTRF